MPLWLSGFVTATSTTPAAWAPVTAVIVPESTTATLVAAVPPRDTEAPVWKFVPVILTGVPPVPGPAPGLMPVTATPEPEAVIGRVAVLLEGPQRDVVVGIDDELGKVAPALAVGGLDVVGSRARLGERRSRGVARRVRRQPAGHRDPGVVVDRRAAASERHVP